MTIQTIAPNTWVEKAVGNVFTVIAKIARIVAQSGAKISSTRLRQVDDPAATMYSMLY